jgi:phosphoglycolate phosphatase-like HAD superfamily hydrolase
MTDQHPITPPPEVVDRLFMIEGSEEDRIIAAYRAGTDQELEACCEWLSFYSAASDARDLRIARRPQPPNLKEQALEALKALPTPAGQVTADRLDTIRRALEALDD